jgi:hypothetical protein
VQSVLKIEDAARVKKARASDCTARVKSLALPF